MLSLFHSQSFSKSNLNIHTRKIKAGELWPVNFFDANQKLHYRVNARRFPSQVCFPLSNLYISKFNLLPWLIFFFVLARNSYRYISAKPLIFDAFAMFLQNGMGARNLCDKIPFEFFSSSDNAEFSHFTLLFCSGRQRNEQRFITHVHSYCFAH